MSSYSDMVRMAQQQQTSALRIARENNNFNSSEAMQQRRFEKALFKQGNEFNAAEAAKNREWQEIMSNTAHQREVKDLVAAGLNPILSASGGNGAAVTSGATASSLGAPTGHAATADTSANAAIAQITGSLFSYMSNLDAMKTSAQSSQRIAEVQAATQRYVAELSAEASRYASSASMYNAALHAATERGVSASQIASQQRLAEYDFEKQMHFRAYDRETQRKGYDYQLRNQTAGYESQLANGEYMATYFPTTYAQAASAIGARKGYLFDNIYSSVASGVNKLVHRGFSSRSGKY